MSSVVFHDPIYNGATDPVVTWNPADSSWWMMYTARRASLAALPGVAWVHGSDIGVATSADGRDWTYQGTLALEAPDPGRNTLWAPEVVWRDGICHMFVSYIRGAPAEWAGHERTIHRYTSKDLLSWQYEGEVALASRFVIDACVFPRPGGGFRMWYKNEADDNSTWQSDSDDLVSWSDHQLVLRTPGGHEGPNVFALDGSFWMVVDSWEGQLAYRSDDLVHWAAAGVVLDTASGTPTVGAEDHGPGLHADVVVTGGKATIFYFTHPDRADPRQEAVGDRRSTILACDLVVRGDQLWADRDAPSGFPHEAGH
jgi:sucrose-6-phosphate hydrolase SacC (GH32 family)